MNGYNPRVSVNGAGARGLPESEAGYADIIEAMIGGVDRGVTALVNEYRNPNTAPMRKRQIKGDRARTTKDGLALRAEDGLLQSYMACGVFPRGNRKQEACIEHACVMAFDLDGYTSAAAVDAQIGRLHANAYIYYALRSVSGNGIHFGIRISAPDGVDLTDKALHKRGWAWVNEWAVKNLGVNPKVDDGTSRNINRIHFATYDAGGFCNRSVTALAIPAQAFEAPARKQRANGGGINLSLIDMRHLPLYVNDNDAQLYEGLVANLLALDKALAVEYARACAAANPECTRTDVERLERLDIERDRDAAYRKVIALQKDNGWKAPKVGRPSTQALAALDKAAFEAAGVPDDAVWLAPRRSEHAEAQRFYRYGRERLLYVYGLGMQIADRHGFWVGREHNEARLVLRTALDGYCDEAVAELREYDGLDEYADKLARAALPARTLTEVWQQMSDIADSEGITRRTLTEFDRRADLNVYPVDGGVYDIRTGNTITDPTLIRGMLLRRPVTPTPQPDFRILDDPNAALDIDDEIIGATAMRDAVAEHYGLPLIRRLALPLLGAGEFAIVIQSNESRAGKGTLRRAMGRAFPSQHAAIDARDLTLRPRFDPVALALTEDTWAFAEEVGKVSEDDPKAKLNRLFTLTEDVLQVERKGFDKVSAVRVGTLVILTAEDPPIAWHQQGIDRRIPEITLFLRDGLALDDERFITPINRIGADGAAAYLRALVFKTATDLYQRYGGIDRAEVATRTPAGIARLAEIREAAASEEALKIREVYEYSEQFETPTGDIADLLGVSEKSKDLRRHILAAIKTPSGGAIRSKRGVRIGVRQITAWQMRKREASVDSE